MIAYRADTPAMIAAIGKQVPDFPLLSPIVYDCHEMHARLKQAGVKLDREPFLLPFGGYQLNIFDPFGNEICLTDSAFLRSL